MKANATEITEEKNLRGEFCGACHNDKAAFGHTKKNCNKCHNGDIAYGSKFFRALRRLPRDEYGNEVDWVKALKRKKISPKETIFAEPYVPIPFKREFEVDAKASMAPPAEFSHDAHTAWLDCSNCHPDIFSIKKNTTENVTMEQILGGKFCGYCHLSVAFPMDDCKRCHPKIRRDTR
jgi:c(7)-type cytochrome triheme protein